LVPHLLKCKPNVGKKFDAKGNWLPQFIGSEGESKPKPVGGARKDIRGFMDRVWRKQDDDYGNKLMCLWMHTNGIPFKMMEDKYFKLYK